MNLLNEYDSDSSDDNIKINNIDNDIKDNTKERDALGRVRQFAHRDGNWATSIYIEAEIDAKALEEASELGIESVKALLEPEYNINNIYKLPDNAHIPLHMSLCRTFPLREHQIDIFIDEFKKKVSLSKTKNNFPLLINLDSGRILKSEDNERMFLCLCPPIDQISIIKTLIMDCVDAVVNGMFKHPIYHTDPLPHVSIAWWKIEKNNSINNENSNNTISNNDTDTSVIANSINVGKKRKREEDNIDNNNNNQQDKGNCTDSLGDIVGEIFPIKPVKYKNGTTFIAKYCYKIWNNKKI